MEKIHTPGGVRFLKAVLNMSVPTGAWI